MNEKLNHFDAEGNAIMVDVSDKKITAREAVASGKIFVGEEIFKIIQSGNSKKGDILGVARVAGIMAAKKTAEIIPLCHILPITHCKIDFELFEEDFSVKVTSTVKVSGKTGVEMEALHSASVALLTIYDMCKAFSKSMMISEIRLEKKSGGKSGDITF